MIEKEENRSSKSIVKNNIITYLEKKKMSRARCYRMTGICRGVLNQNNGLSEDNIRRFLDRFSQVNPVWLLTGNGPMELSERDAMEKTEALGGASRQMKSIPLVPAQHLAGYFAKGCLATSLSGVEWFDMPIFSGADFLFQMQGSGMSPAYNSGDILICRVLRDEKFMMWNSVYVLDTSIGPIVRRLRRGTTENSLTLVSDDPGYEPMELERSDLYHFAVVIGLLRMC